MRHIRGVATTKGVVRLTVADSDVLMRFLGCNDIMHMTSCT